MPVLLVTSLNGQQTKVNAEVGFSIMETMRSAGLDELRAICGGAGTCGTCHVYVDPAFYGALGVMGEDESDLLESCERRQATSRLSCQIVFTADLDGLCVTIAPYP